MKDIRVVTDFPRKVREIENLWIPMPDGVKLAARIWLPEDAATDPVPAMAVGLAWKRGTEFTPGMTAIHGYFRQLFMAPGTGLAAR